MESEPESKTPLSIKLTIFQRLNPFYKTKPIEITILSLLIMGSFLNLYYLTYQDARADLIFAGILPQDLSWLLGLAIGIFVLGILLTLVPVDTRIYEKLQKISDIEKNLATIQELFFDAKYDEIITSLENHLYYLKEHNIYQFRYKIDYLLNKAQMNRDLRNALQKIDKAINENQIYEAQHDSKLLHQFMSFHYQELSKQNIQQYEDLVNQLQSMPVRPLY